MERLEPSDIRLRDPLSEVTRKERRALLGVSALGIVIVWSGLVPSKVSALGIEFTRIEQQALILALGAIVAFFLVAFVVYAASDLTAWRAAYHNSVAEEQRPKEFTGAPERDYYIRWHALAIPMSLLRAGFEFGVPIIIGIFATLLLFTASPPLPTPGEMPRPGLIGGFADTF